MTTDIELTGHLTPYAEMANILADLSMLVREARRARRLTMQAVSEQMTACSASTLCRIENGDGQPSLGVAIELLRWLDLGHTP